MTTERTTAGSDTSAAEQEFLISRVFDAPRALVWKAATEPERLMRWWGPKGLTMQVAKLDLRPGGVFHYGMRAPGGKDMWGKFVYREVTAPERLVFVNSFSDEHGNTTRHPLSASWPLELLNTWLFTESDGKTTLTLRGRPLNASETEQQTFAQGHNSMRAGFKGTFDQLDAYLEEAARESA